MYGSRRWRCRRAAATSCLRVLFGSGAAYQRLLSLALSWRWRSPIGSAARNAALRYAERRV